MAEHVMVVASDGQLEEFDAALVTTEINEGVLCFNLHGVREGQVQAIELRGYTGWKRFVVSGEPDPEALRLMTEQHRKRGASSRSAQVPTGQFL